MIPGSDARLFLRRSAGIELRGAIGEPAECSRCYHHDTFMPLLRSEKEMWWNFIALTPTLTS
jgi:hypothetical protein